jgi:hypothetical protein
VPGSLLGLAGPPALNMAAVEAGEAALFPGSGLALVPEVVGAGVFWQAPTQPPVAGVPDVREADRWLRETYRVAQALTDLDVRLAAGDRRCAVGASRRARGPLPAGFPCAPRAGRPALRCQAIVGCARAGSRPCASLTRPAAKRPG